MDKNDIYIDLRNIEIETNNWVDGVGQSYIDKNDESVYYPELDRISSNIYEKINENIKNGFFKAPLTISFRNYSMQFEDIKIFLHCIILWFFNAFKNNEPIIFCIIRINLFEW